MKKFTFTMIFLALAVITFGQNVQTAKSAREAGVVTGSVGQPKISNVFTEDFEAFVFPGTMNGWTRVQNNVTATWDTSTMNPYTGLRNVHCEYDSNLAAQNEWLITPAFNLTGAAGVSVSFAWNGSKYWSIFPNHNCDLFLKYTTDDGASWSSEVWSQMTDDTASFINWTWAVATISVPGAAGQSNVKFALQYWGTDGAEFSVDEFKVDTTNGSGAGVAPVSLTPVQFNIYPNPASDNLTVESSFEVQNIRIFNDFGQMVLEQALAGKTAILNISELKDGLYFVEVLGENGKFTKKIAIR